MYYGELFSSSFSFCWREGVGLEMGVAGGGGGGGAKDFLNVPKVQKEE